MLKTRTPTDTPQRAASPAAREHEPPTPERAPGDHGAAARAQLMTAMQETAGNARLNRAAGPPPPPARGLPEDAAAPAGVTVQRHCGSPTGCAACRQTSAAISEIAQRKDIGSPLPADSQSLMGSRLGADFSAVRLHTDERAAESAERLGARAFTMGNDVFFARGQYEPGSTSGQGLLAHELTHVVQQQHGRRPAGGIDTPGDPHEQEAEAAARAVTSGKTATIAGAASPPPIQRALAAPAPKPAAMAGKVFRVPTNDADLTLKVPGEKVSPLGNDQNDLQDRYKRMADARALRTTHAGRGSSTTLWNAWEKSRKFPIPLSDAEKAKKKQACQVDHAVELQVGGADAPDNLRLLGSSRNMSAGSQLSGRVDQLRALAQARYNLNPDAVLEFSTVKVEKATGPDPDCLDWELKQVQGPVEAAGKSVLNANVGGRDVAIGYNPDNGKVHAHSRYTVPGFHLHTVEQGSPGFVVTGSISERAKIPFLQKIDKLYYFTVPSAGGKLEQQPPKTLGLAFPFLSEAALAMTLEQGQLRAAGSFRPTLPLLRHVDINLLVENEQLSGGVSVPPEKLKQALPIPGLEITDATLGFSVADGKFVATGGFGVKYGTVADGRVEAKISGKGFEALGTLNLHVPGLDEAKGQVWVREGKLGGQIKVGADKLKVPGVRSASLTVTIQDGALAGHGVVQLAVPGVKEGALDFGVDKAGNYAITGTAKLSIPGLDEATLALTYRNGDIEGAAHVGLKIPGLEGATFDLRYAQGQLTGAGRLSYKKGRLSGTVTLALSERHRLSGGGELAYEIAPGLVAFAGLQVTEEGKTKISGGLRVPETIDLFGRKQIEKELYKLPTIEIPILAIPLGTRSVGIVATIDARLVARAGIGPGQLRKVKLLAEFDPSSDESAFSFQAAAELYVPASAELALGIAGGIGVSLAIVRAVGGIEAEGAAGVAGELIAASQLEYQNGQFAVSGQAELSAQPKLVFRVKAFVKAEADLFFTSIELYRKDWVLASVEAGSALRVGVRMPFKYVFGQPFQLSLDQVEFIVPQISAKEVMKDLLPV
jgi:Domain of unknown function (DUF4157)